MCLACAVLVTMTGCSNASSASKGTGSSNASGTAGASMAGPQVQVQISQAALNSRPRPWVLSTPQSAVRSYLDWTAYAYRIATSDVATPTMGASEGVHVDSYVQFNLEKSRLLDETLSSITFGKLTVEATHTLVPTTEKWRYSYRSIKAGNKVVGGPYSVSYDTTYTVVKTKKGTWMVESAVAKALGPVK